MRISAVMRALVMCAVVAATSVVVSVGSAAPAAAASGCRAAPYSATVSNVYVGYWDSTDASYYNWLPSWPGTYSTTTQCNDIQIKSTNGVGFYACVVFTKYSATQCNYLTWVPSNGSWVNIATDVKDYTAFRVGVSSYNGPITISAVLEF